MKFKCIYFVILSITLACSAKVSQKQSQDNILRIKGSDTMLLLVQEWAERFMKENPEISVYVEGGGSKTGIDALIKGDIDISAASRPWQPDEIKELVEKQGSLGISVLCARDALSLYLHPENPVRNLTVDQVKDIFSGNIKNWREVGGDDQTIEVLNRNPNSGTYLFFSEHLLLGQQFTKEAVTLPTTNAIAQRVQQNSAAIGYGGMSYGDDLLHCKINGIQPTPQNVRNGTYPIARYLYLYTARPPRGNIKKFVDWVLSPEGQKVVEVSGYIPLYEIE